MTQEIGSSMLIRNTPKSQNEWKKLIDSKGVTSIDTDFAQMAIVQEKGQLTVHWAFEDINTMREHFLPMFEELKPEIADADVDFIALDLVQFQNRDWIQPLLQDANFYFFAEWMNMENPGLDPEDIPDFPDDVIMRQATDDDVEKMYSIWVNSYGDLTTSPATFDYYLENQTWIGALERNGEVVGFAINGPVVSGSGEVFEVAVDADFENEGYKSLLLSAATYQLTTQDARRATIKVRPDIKNALRTCSDLGFRPVIGGLEYRRSTDEEYNLAKQEERRSASGVKARFGDWR
ncbi:MAG: GNAT family N-acetyltransferase [Dehalococcoidia bacterium]